MDDRDQAVTCVCVCVCVCVSVRKSGYTIPWTWNCFLSRTHMLRSRVKDRSRTLVVNDEMLPREVIIVTVY